MLTVPESLRAQDPFTEKWKGTQSKKLRSNKKIAPVARIKLIIAPIHHSRFAGSETMRSEADQWGNVRPKK